MHFSGFANPPTSHPIFNPFAYPERAIIGGTEHFGLIRGGNDGQGIHCAHMSRQRPHLFFGLNVPNLAHRESIRNYHVINILKFPGFPWTLPLVCKALQSIEINTSYMNEVLIGATNYMVVGDCNRVHTASRGLEDMHTLQRTDVPYLRGKRIQTISFIHMRVWKFCMETLKSVFWFT